MALPSLETPRYELTLPSQDIKVQFRPFLVKEEKILMTALDTGEERDIQNATKQIINACTFEALDVENLPTFDIEYILLQIRSKSVGELAKFKVICPDDRQTYTDVEIDISKVEVQVDDEHSNKIILDEQRQLGVVLKYPTMKLLNGTSLKDTTFDSVFDMMIDCVDSIFEKDKVYPGSESTKEELREFFEKLPQQYFDKIRHFFDTMPRLRHEVEVTNPKTGVKSKVTFSGLVDFFGSASPITA